jgi:prephenate dehydrogenase (NADP+)
MNPSAQRQITQYAASVTELFKLMAEGKETEFANRVHTAGRFVFGERKDDAPRLLRDDILDQFSLSGVPQAERVPNNQLALLSMVDCWWKLGLNPYDHMICSTPVSSLMGWELRLGISVMAWDYGVFVSTAWIIG